MVIRASQMRLEPRRRLPPAGLCSSSSRCPIHPAHFPFNHLFFQVAGETQIEIPELTSSTRS